jgi:pyrroline-5-carboxylate reductase
MIGIIGAGNMGRAIALRIGEKAIVSDIVKSNLAALKNKRIKITGDNAELARKSNIIILAVKPRDIEGVLKQIGPYLAGKLIISIAAGVRTSTIEKIIDKIRVIRVMPNMPAQEGKGMSAVSAGKFVSKQDISKTRGIFLKLGEVVEVKESMMDAVTAVSGSGPAYYFLFTDLLEKAGVKIGLNKGLARKLASATFVGSAGTIALSDITMREGIKKVASKGGTTEAALEIFQKNKLGDTIEKAVKAAKKRSKNLSK